MKNIYFVGRDNIKVNASTLIYEKIKSITNNKNIYLIIDNNRFNMNYYRDDNNVIIAKNYYSKIKVIINVEELVIFINIGLKNIIPFILRKILKKKSAFFIDEDVYYLFRGMKGIILKFFEIIVINIAEKVFVSSLYYMEILKKYVISDVKIFHLPYSFSILEMKNIKKQTNNKTDDIIDIIFIGSSLYYKLYRSYFKELISDKRFVLHIIGNGFEEYEKELCEFSNVILHGFLDNEDIEKLCENITYAWLPLEDNEYNKRRSPNKVYEYMKLGLIIIALDNDSLKMQFSDDLIYYKSGCLNNLKLYKKNLPRYDKYSYEFIKDRIEGHLNE